MTSSGPQEIKMTYAHTDQFYINGAWVAPAATEWLEVINPATEKPFARIAMGSETDVDRAVAAAKAAFRSWSATPLDQRLACIERILKIYKRRHDEFAVAITTEMGAPIDLSRDEQAYVGVSHAEAVLEAARAMRFEEELSNGDTLLRQPIGVVGMITPWNWPINQIALKVLPALAAGCTMVLKPSELTPISAILYAEVLDEAGVPPGVFNLVQGAGPVVGAALSRHRDVAMMSFTGSLRGGSAVTTDSAPTVKRVALELGGKSPNLIFADADIEAAVSGGVHAITANTGQSCDAPSRMLVEASIFDKAVEIAKRTAEGIKVGDPATEGEHIGPLASKVQFDRVQDMIETGIAEGARVLIGGPGRPEGFETGYYVRPTIFVDVNPDMRIVREEIFGPVLVMMPFADEDAAIALANDSDYGLASYISSGDPARVHRVARRLQAGMVNVNGGFLAAGSPFGGVKASGNGREGGAPGIEEFLETKVITRF